jgi:hypothetical protein
MALVGWLDTVAVVDQWFDAPEEPVLTDLLAGAYNVCLAYAPTPPATIPPEWKTAQLLQAKHMFARSKAGNGDSIGPDGYQVSTFPLVLESRNLLRPKRNPFLGVL